MHLTDLSLKKLAAPPKGQVTYIDDSLKGFGVRVSQGGTRTFVLVHGERRKRTTIGRYPVLSLAQARRKARDILAEKRLKSGEAVPILFDEALETFFTVHCRQNNKPSTIRSTERLLRRHFLPQLKSREMAEIQTADLTAIVDTLLDTPGEANHAFTAGRTFFRWAVGRRYIAHSPLEGLKKPAKTLSRDRVLSDAELAAVLKAARSMGTYGSLIQALTLSLQRLGQIANLRAEWIDRENKLIKFPGEVMKGNHPHTIPYDDMSARLFETLPKQGYLFRALFDKKARYNNFSTDKQALDKLCPIPHWTLHDLRRTGATRWAELGIPPHVTEKMLDHKTGTLSAVARIYNRHTYLEEMRSAVSLWERRLAQIHISTVAA